MLRHILGFFPFPVILGSAQSLIGLLIVIFMDPQDTVHDAAVGNPTAQTIAPPTTSTGATPTTAGMEFCLQHPSIHPPHFFSRVLHPPGINAVLLSPSFHNRACRGGIYLPHPKHSNLPHRSHERVQQTSPSRVHDGPVEALEEAKSCEEKIQNCRAGQHQRRCAPTEECRALEGSLGGPTHLRRGGDA